MISNLRVIRTFFFLLFFLTAVACVAGTNKRIVRVGYYIRKGFQDVDSRGYRTGFGYDYLMAVASHADWELQFTGMDKTRLELINMLKDGKIDLMVGVVPFDNFKKYLDFSESPIMLVHQNIFVRSDQGKKYIRDDYSTWKGMKLALVKNRQTNMEILHWAKDNNVLWQPVYFATDIEAENAFSAGEVDALLSSSLRKQDNAKEIYLKSLFQQQINFAVKKGNSELLREINEAHREVAYEEPNIRAELLRKYYKKSFSYALRKKDILFLEKCRRENKVFNVLINPKRKPLSYWENGVLKGFQVNFVRKILNHSGLKYKVIPCLTLHEYRKRLENNDYDILLDATTSYARNELEGKKLTSVYLSGPISTIACNHGKKKSGKFGATWDSNTSNALIEQNVDCTNAKWYMSWDDMLTALQNGEIDYAYMPTRSCIEIVKQPHKYELSTSLHPNLVINYTFAVSKFAPAELLRILNNAIAVTSPQELQDSMAGFSYRVLSDSMLKTIVNKYPMHIVLGFGSVFLIILILVALYLFQVRRALRYSEIMSKLPFRFIVANANGEIVMHNSHNQIGGETAVSEEEFFEVMKKNAKDAIAKKHDHFEFSVGDNQRYFSTVTPLRKEVVGKKCVVCIAQNTTEILNAKEKAEEYGRRLLLTLQSIGDAIIVTDQDGNVTLVNPVAERLLGMSEQEVCGKFLPDVMNIISYIDGSRVANPVLECIKTRSIVELANHTDLISKNGKKYHISDSASPIINKSGKLLGAILDIRDVTEAYEQRDRINSLMEYFKQVTNLAPITFVSKYQDGESFRYDFINEKAAKEMRVTSEFGHNKTVFEIPSLQQVAEQFNRDDLAIANDESGEIQSRDFSLIRPNGVRQCGRMYRKCYRDKLGKKTLLVASVDTTELENQKLELTKAMEEAVLAQRSKSYFLAVMSHEIRTPLNVVIGLTELLQMGNCSQEESKEFLKAVNEAANTLLNLINSILDLSKLNAEQVSVYKEPVSIQEFMSTIRQMFLAEMQKKDLTFDLILPPYLPVLKMDQVHVRQIIVNLIGNALKFTTHGGVTIKVDFNQNKVSGNLSIKVIDTGIGMNEETLKRIFDPFAQGDESRGSRMYGGTGLGLTICKQLAELMNGSVAVTSEQGKGSTFTLILNDLEIVENLENIGNKSIAHFKNLSSKRILIVDDVSTNRLVLSMMLKKSGITTEQAQSGEEALELLEKQDFDIILSDLWMPGMNGIEFAKKARSTKRGKLMKIIALTADVDANGSFDMSPFDSTIYKPITLNKINDVFTEL